MNFLGEAVNDRLSRLLRDETFNWLERGVNARDADSVFLKVAPVWNNLRDDPRFHDLMRRMNFE